MPSNSSFQRTVKRVTQIASAAFAPVLPVGTCGSPLPGWNEDDDEVGIPAGLLDQDPGAQPSLHIIVGSKAPWHEIGDDLPRYETFPDSW